MARSAAAGSPRSIARTMSRCCSTTTDSTTAGATSARSGGWRTSTTHALKAAASRLPAMSEIWRCRRSSTEPTSAASSGRLSASASSACNAATSSSVARCAASPTSGTSNSIRVSSSSSIVMLCVASMLATDALTVRPMPSSGVAATKIPPPGPFDARTRCELDSRRSASRSVGRLTPNWRARSSSRPRRSPGVRPCFCMYKRIASATCSEMLRRSARRWGSALMCPSALPGQRRGRRRPQVGDPPRLADLRRQDARLQRHDTDPQPERLAQLRLDGPCLDRPRQLDLELDLVHRRGIAVERDAELADALVLAQDLLDRRGEDVHPADDDHVVGAPEDALRQPPPGVPDAAVDRGCLDDVSGAVAHDGEAGPRERGHDELAGRAVGHGLAGLRVQDLGDELVLAQMHPAAAVARIGERADLRQAGVVEALRAPAHLDPAPHGRDRRAGLAGAHDALDR